MVGPCERAKCECTLSVYVWLVYTRARVSYIPFRGHALYARMHDAPPPSPPTSSSPPPPRAPPQHSLAVHVLRRSRVARCAFSVAPHRGRSLVQGLVRAYISKPVVTAPPRRYLSHASGADFYRRDDSRGKFIKSPPLPFRGHIARARFHGD